MITRIHRRGRDVTFIEGLRPWGSEAGFGLSTRARAGRPATDGSVLILECARMVEDPERSGRESNGALGVADQIRGVAHATRRRRDLHRGLVLAEHRGHLLIRPRQQRAHVLGHRRVRLHGIVRWLLEGAALPRLARRMPVALELRGRDAGERHDFGIDPLPRIDRLGEEREYAGPIRLGLIEQGERDNSCRPVRPDGGGMTQLERGWGTSSRLDDFPGGAAALGQWLEAIPRGVTWRRSGRASCFPLP